MPKHTPLKPDEYGGFILAFEPARTDSIYESLSDKGIASESFSAEDWSFEKCEMIFLARREPVPTIFGAALMRRMGGTGGTRRIRMRITEPLLFLPSVDASEADNGVGLSHFISTAENLKRIDSSTWRQLITLLKNLRTFEAEKIDHLVARRMEDRRILGDDPKSKRIAEQRDAVGITLNIANVDKRPILGMANVEDVQNIRSILEILDAQPIAERSLIEHDSRIFNIELSAEAIDSASFQENGSEVRVYVVDGTPLETATGTDLFIYQERYNSFLMLQYKAMENDSLIRGWSYKVDGSNLDQQLQTISALRKAFPVISSPKKFSDHRLSDDPFYFKFCERTRLSSRDDSLSAGMTINAEHLAHFLSLPEAKLDGEIRRIGYKNLPRYLNNSEFIALARSGWIGSKTTTTEMIAQIMRSRESGRSAIFSYIKNKQASRGESEDRVI